MEPVEGARTFQTTGAAYDAFMGRYSRALAPVLADHLRLAPGRMALDVGCGPGALTGVLAARLDATAVLACDPSPGFVEECATRHPGVEVRIGRAEAVPFPDGCVDIAAAQLVLHFVTDPSAAIDELRRVVRPGGTIGACVWDFGDGMEMLRTFWDAALELDPGAPDEARTLRFGRPGEIAELFVEAGLTDIEEFTLEVRSEYEDFDELWTGFLAGIGPAGAYAMALAPQHRTELRDRLRQRLGNPPAAFGLTAVARAATATRPPPE